MTERDFELISILNQTKNITKAADILFVSQSALSKRIQSIEEELGIKLLIRSRQGIQFTPDGEEVLAYTQRCIKELQNMRNALDTNRGYICGTLNVGISINYALYRLPDLLADYRSKFSHVNTQVTTGQSHMLYSKIQDGALDIAIIRGEFPWRDHKILLEREPICLICSLDDRDKPLSELSYIGRKTDATLDSELGQWFRENNLHIQQQGIFVDSITTCVEMVNRGLGWAIVPEICLNDFNGYVMPLKFNNGDQFMRSTYLMYSDNVLQLPQVEAFINTVKEYHKIR